MNRHDRHRLRDLRDDRRSVAPAPNKGVAAKVFWIAIAVGIGAFAVSKFNSERSAEPLPPKAKLESFKKAKNLQEQVVAYGIEGGAVAGKKALAADSRISATPGDTAPDPHVVVTDREFVVKGVWSDSPYVLPRDHELAEKDALAKARRVLVEKGLVADGNWQLVIDRSEVIPPTAETRKLWEEGKVEPDRGWLAVDAKLTHDSVRKESAAERTTHAAFWFGTAFLALLAVYGFLKLDTWTKGYLTLLLGIVVGGVVVAAVIGLGMLVL